MPSAGELLRNERIRQHRGLSEISSQTCISTRYLQAIEADDVGQLPGDFFYRSFLRQYAESLHLDEGATEQVVAAAVPIEVPDPLPAMNHMYDKAQTGGSTRWTPSTSFAVCLLIAVMVAGSGLYALWQRFQADADETPAPTASAQPAPTAQAPPVDSTAPAARPTEQTAQPPAAPAASDGNFAVELSSTEPAWVSLSSAGKTVFIGTLQPAEPHQFQVEGDAKLLTGNAGALEIRLNGKPLGTIGPRGQIRTVLFSSGNFQILQPKTKSPPPSEGSTTTTDVALRHIGVEH